MAAYIFEERRLKTVIEDVQRDDEATISLLGSGRYTVMRTMGVTNVVSLDLHAQRLQIDKAELKMYLRTVYGAADWTHEQRIVVGRSEAGRVLVKHKDMPTRDTCGTKVKLVYGSRGRASEKRIEWIRERKQFKEEGFEETVLVNEATGEILEGLSSNFYGIRGGAIYTARPDRVLGGTIASILQRRLPVKYGLTIGMPVDAAFITSTSRLIMPITELHYPDGRVVMLCHHDLIRIVQQHVYTKLEQESESFLI